MVRYIIPFVYKASNYYAFIGKHNGSQNFEITQLVPESEERFDRQIPLTAIQSIDDSNPDTVLNLQQTITRQLAAYLQEKGGPNEEEAA